jgi:hypothetical protein
MNQEQVNNLLTDLQEKWPITDVVQFDDFNLADKLQNLPYQLMRFNEQYIKAKARMDELIDIKNRVTGKKYDILRFHNDKALTNKEIEQYYLPMDKDIIRVNNAIAKQEVIVNYFEVCVKSLDKLQWNIKLYMEDRKYSA